MTALFLTFNFVDEETLRLIDSDIVNDSLCRISNLMFHLAKIN
jgi:hypothetical protein